MKMVAFNLQLCIVSRKRSGVLHLNEGASPIFPGADQSRSCYSRAAISPRMKTLEYLTSSSDNQSPDYHKLNVEKVVNTQVPVISVSYVLFSSCFIDAQPHFVGSLHGKNSHYQRYRSIIVARLTG